MQNRRLLFTVIIKLLVLSGLLLLLMVFINSLFIKDDNTQVVDKDEQVIASLDITGMQKGQIRKTRWNNKEVAILFRQNPKKLGQAITDTLKEDLHPSIESKIRSKTKDYFVYFNTGDSNNCPLYYAGGEFKDVCTSNKFDETGRSINASINSSLLKIPPHYFVQDSLIIGRW